MLVSANADGTETVSMASAALSCDDGPESEFNFDQLNDDSSGNNRRRQNRDSALSGTNNIMV